VRQALLAAVSCVVFGAGLRAQETAPPAFERDVLPILERRCFRCHKAPETDTSGRVQQPKGGLRLDGRTHFLRGGDGGPVLVPGDADDSEIYLRVILPPEDPDYMPSKGEGLGEAEQQMLRRWIESGAGFGAWQGATDAAKPVSPDVPAREALPMPTRIERLRAIADGLPQPAEALITRIEKAGAQVRSLLGSDDRRLLRVSFPSGATAIGREQLGALAALRSHTAEIVLARTTFDEAALFAELGRMTRLHRIDLRETAVEGAGLSRLGSLEHLGSLNLFGCRSLGDEAITALARLESVQRLYVWQSGLTENGVARLRAALPGVQIISAPELPEPRREVEPPRRRR
jgi:hypothetical protein